MDRVDSSQDINERIWHAVAAIPIGTVSTYGAIAHQAGIARAARRVGYALRLLPSDSRIPWHRVVNARGSIAFPKGTALYKEQRHRLESEGIAFNRAGCIDLQRFGN